MNGFAGTVVFIAACLYLLSLVYKAISALVAYSVQNRIADIDDLHDATEEEIETSFELWWEEGPKEAAIAKLYSDLGFEEYDEFGEGYRRFMIADKLEDIHDCALHLAMHAHMDATEQTMIHKLPRLFLTRKIYLHGREEHEKELNKERGELLDYGINPIKLKEHFTKAA